MEAGVVDRLYSLGNFATPRHVDFACRTGLFHSLWFDLEHFDLPIRDLAVLNLVARAHPVTTVARVNLGDYATVERVIATGVGGIMAAMVNTAEEARRIVEWAKVARLASAADSQLGLQRPIPHAMAGPNGTAPGGGRECQPETGFAIICQIETEEAVAELDAIVAVVGVDGIFFGPGDYAHRIGRLGEISHPQVMAAMQQVGDACRRRRKFWGTISLGREHYQRVRALGAQLIGVGGDVRVMHHGMRELAKSFADE